MIQVECTNCARRLRVEDKAAGKSIKCPCGTSLKVPSATPTQGAAPTRPQGSASHALPVPRSLASAEGKSKPQTASGAPTSYLHRCECGRSLRVNASDQPKKAKCPCGLVFMVPDKNSIDQSQNLESLVPPTNPASNAVVVQAVPVASTNWFDDLPIPQNQREAPYVPYSGTISPTYGVTTQASGSRNVDAPSNRSMAESYLAKAEDEVYNRDSGSNEGGFWDASALGGILMMLGAVVWFVVGLANDIIFFYPPVLFIAGLIALIKGLM